MTSNSSYIFDRSFLELYQGYPGVFGEPDGRRADLADFIDISELRRSAFFSPAPSKVRIVVGRKGSGKTLYLKKLEADALWETKSEGIHSRTIIVDAEQTQLPGTRQVFAVARWFPNAILTEVWQQAWGRAIMLSLLSQVYFNQDYRHLLDSSARDSLKRDFANLFDYLGKDPRTPFTTLRTLIGRADTGDATQSSKLFASILDDPLWDDLEARLSRLLRETQAVYMYIDAIDEEFSHAPMYWMRCQKGLFYEVMRLLRHSGFGTLLHIVISIREIVLHSVFRSEHAPRYIGDPHIRVLEWGFEAAQMFLDRKIAKLDPEYWHSPKRPTSLPGWIGFSHVKNRHNQSEPVYDYLLRHTQCLPREMVILGNLLGRELDQVERQGKAFSEDDFHEVVATVARVSGLFQLEMAANQIRSDEIPREAFDKDFIDSYLAVQEYADGRAQELINLIAPLEYLRVTPSKFAEFEESGLRALGAPDIGSVLWQAGLLGFVDSSDRDIFFSLDRVGRFLIPKGAKEYVWHPSMREVAGLQPLRRPVLWRQS